MAVTLILLGIVFAIDINLWPEYTIIIIIDLVIAIVMAFVMKRMFYRPVAHYSPPPPQSLPYFAPTVEDDDEDSVESLFDMFKSAEDDEEEDTVYEPQPKQPDPYGGHMYTSDELKDIMADLEIHPYVPKRGTN
jgi:hypothetical protein